MDDSSQKAHHIRSEVCANRPKYRDGRKLKSVKVYTASQESQYLLVQGVPSIGIQQEIIDKFSSYGVVAEFRSIENYSTEQFTEVILIKFARIQSARVAKNYLDDCNFYGGVLHVCYAPEFESIDETSAKLDERKRSIARRLRQLSNDAETQTRNDSVAKTTEETSLRSDENDGSKNNEKRNETDDVTSFSESAAQENFQSTSHEESWTTNHPIQQNLFYPPLPLPPCPLPAHMWQNAPTRSATPFPVYPPPPPRTLLHFQNRVPQRFHARHRFGTN